MGFQLDVMFIDSFMDDVTYIRDVEVCVECGGLLHTGVHLLWC
jgi:hypothetical protein